MKLAAILSVIAALILGVTTWYFSQSASRLEKSEMT